MKKMLTMILVLAFMCTIIAPKPASAFAKAEQKIKLEEAINTAKTKLGIKTENYNFNYVYNENRDGISCYEMNWTSKKANSGNINVSVNSETGEIINFYQWSQSSEAPAVKIPKYSKAEALKAAQEFIKKLAPTKFAQSELKEQQAYYDMPIYSDSYNFNFTRKVNGLEFVENGFNISLDKNTLQVRSYNMNWDNGTFTDPAKAISLSDAQKVFASKLGIELSYYMVYDYTAKTQTPILVYTYANGNNPIDAVTGEIISNGYNRYADEKANYSLTKDSGAMTPEEQKSVDASDKYVSKDAAIAAAKNYLAIDDTTKLNYANLSVDIYDGSASWMFNWEKTDSTGKNYTYMSATINAVTGKIRSFSMGGNEYYPEKETTPSYTKEQAKKVADDFIGKLEPENFKISVYKDDNYTPQPTDKVSEYSFRYVAKINGASCSFDNFYITVNAYTGKIMSYSMQWKDITLPSAEGALTLDNAYKALYQKASLKLRYIKSYDYSKIRTTAYDIKLAYVLDDFSGMFDAKTGNFVDYDGKPVKEKKAVKFTDIKGNAAENDINILIDLGVIDSQDSKFGPNDTILQKDFIKLLSKTISPIYSTYRDGAATDTDKEYDEYYQIAIQRNILKESQINKNAKVSKLDAVKMIVRAMGIGYVAESGNGNIYNLQYKDANKIPASYKGYVAIAAGLNIIKAGATNFEGTKQITKGQIATMLVNYMKVDLNK